MSDEQLDLHSLAVLINYERSTTDPRFKGTALLEVGNETSTLPFTTLGLPDARIMALWHDHRGSKTSIAVEAADKPPDYPDSLHQPQVSPGHDLSARELETLYWQTRSHDVCYESARILQLILDLQPDDHPLRVRAADGVDFTSTVSSRRIRKYDLRDPTHLTFIVTLPQSSVYTTGNFNPSKHGVVTFVEAHPVGAPKTAVLDMTSMQFGDAGRGFGNKGVFVLELLEAYELRLKNFAKSFQMYENIASGLLAWTEDGKEEWFEDIAGRVMARWEARATSPWCAYCGAPAEKRCCGTAFYCDRPHQVASWPFHKHFCERKASAETK
ncbi:hypothetical protein B0H14DRAFT_2856737 [Mycena olivaceomarginata]|nr:hypothetical protein B0H14DRAFT_2856737 [Mycena olivaceomarginata]